MLIRIDLIFFYNNKFDFFNLKYLNINILLWNRNVKMIFEKKKEYWFFCVVKVYDGDIMMEFVNGNRGICNFIIMW